MTILSSLAKAYDRLPDAPPFGYSSEKIGFVISLNEDGSVAHVTDLRTGEGRKAKPRVMQVPASFKRPGTTPRAFFLWDNSAYVLGVSGDETKDCSSRHAAFKELHLKTLADETDAGLRAVRRFLETWHPEDFHSSLWPDAIKDQNIVFALDYEHRQRLLHERPVAKALWSRLSKSDSAETATCLVTGETAPIARLHQAIKGVWGGQVAGGSIVSFNLDAFTSYGHEQGENAPVSEAAAFAYTTALNRFLERDSGHRIQIGDASTVFWADASEMDVAKYAEVWGGFILDAEEIKKDEETDLTRDIRHKLARLVKGADLKDIEPKLAKDVTFYVLGLSPNAARISVRFYWQGSFGTLTNNYRDYLRDMAFEPWPLHRPRASIRKCVARLGPARIDRSGKVTFDHEQVPQRFTGELLRSIISGSRFPGAMLGLLLMRIRSDHLVDPTRVAMIKAILVRDLRLRGKLPQKSDGTEDEEYLMEADPEDPNIARRLGRLFAVLERVQSASLGEDVNATIKDRYLSAAAATPQQVFPKLLQLAERHVTRLRRGHSDAEWIANAAKQNGISTGEMAQRVASKLGAQIGRIAATFFQTGFPVQHDHGEQGFFMIGYYQERYGRKSGGHGDDDADFDADIANETDED